MKNPTMSRCFVVDIRIFQSGAFARSGGDWTTCFQSAPVEQLQNNYQNMFFFSTGAATINYLSPIIGSKNDPFAFTESSSHCTSQPSIFLWFHMKQLKFQKVEHLDETQNFHLKGTFWGWRDFVEIPLRCESLHLCLSYTTRQELWRSFVLRWWGLGNDGGLHVRYRTTRGPCDLLIHFILQKIIGWNPCPQLFGDLWWCVMKTLCPCCDIW